MHGVISPLLQYAFMAWYSIIHGIREVFILPKYWNHPTAFPYILALLFVGKVAVFWVVTPCSDVVGYQRFGGPCCLHVQSEVK
jgi:hypothetical protein